MHDDPQAPGTTDAHQHPETTDAHDASEASWWDVSMNRRDVNKAGASMAVLLSASGILTLEGCCGGSDSKVEDIKELDSLSAQKKHGWDVGDKGKSLKFKGKVDKDSKDSKDWESYVKKPSKLVKATKPSDSKFAALASPTLFQSLEQKSLAKQAKPVYTSDMKVAHGKGRAVSTLVLATKEPSSSLIILDMPGHLAVAAAAGMSKDVTPAFHFDNWPHPDGVVDSDRTLGAALYYAEELNKNADKRPKEAPAALVLDSNRLKSYSDSSTKFDNRYIANVPDAKALKKLGIKQILYVTDKRRKNELDDLNGPFVDYKKADIKVAMVSFESFKRDPKAPSEDSSTGGYYYGGGYHHHRHFYSHYPMFFFYSSSPRYSTWSRSPTAPPSSVAPKPGYSPAARKTMFSNRTTGAKAGVGRTKPTGFGRVSMRGGAAGGFSRVSRSAARSGSFGRSRSGGFG